MLRLLIPILLAIAGLGGGIGAGVMLRPDPDAAVSGPCGEAPEAGGGGSGEKAGKDGAHGGAEGSAKAKGANEDAGEEDGEHEYVKLNNQFVVPVVEGGQVVSLVIMSLSLEVKAGVTEEVYSREPKLRDRFLEVLFAHANAGGFAGTFTESSNMGDLRAALLEVAEGTLGERVTDVLITDIVRQDS
ncbi:MAG: flagellar basal body-associated FliL family protein [Paracoccaceae bacterium]